MIMLPLLCILSGFILSWIAVGFLSLIVPRLGDNFAGIFIIYVTFGCGVIGLIQGWQFWRAQLKLQAQSDETPH